MAGLSWMTVVLVFLLSTDYSLADVDQNKLTQIVKVMTDTYNIRNQVSVAVNIPENQDVNQLNDAFWNPQAVAKTIKKKLVYIDNGRIVAAKPEVHRDYTVHAEVRVLGNMQTLVNSANGHFLVFYSFLSSCSENCMNPSSEYSIIPKINEVFPSWNQFAFVFSKVFEKTSKGEAIPKADIVEALKQLGKSKVGYNNVFRCYEPKNKDFQCINCFNGEEPVDQCLANDN
ncbi:uncharacterized protein [Trachinotus anak]|uniref:uncharacterized protein n=1 Tax=Trachinotus anak TaxID=443729 RepID=UPI0039F20279